MRVSEKTRIAADRETVWAWVCDPARYPQFMDGVSRWSVLGEKDTGCGARWDVKLMIGAAPVGGIVEVVEFDEPGDIAWNSVTGVTMRGRWRIRTRPNGKTEVDLRLAYQSPGGVMGLIADRVAQPWVRRSLRRSLRNLQMLVESRPAPKRLEAGSSSSSGSPTPAKKAVAKKAARKSAATKSAGTKSAATKSAATKSASRATSRSSAAKKTTKAAPRKRAASASS